MQKAIIYTEVNVTLVVVQLLEKISKNENDTPLGRRLELHFTNYHLNFILVKFIISQG